MTAPNTMTSHDLTSEEGMLAWLHASSFQDGKKVTTVERLSEGFTGFVYRARLQDSEQASVIVKHAESYAARASHWRLDQSRMDFENHGLAYLSTLQIGPEMRVGAPKVLFYDEKNYVLVMSDLGHLPSVRGWLQPGMDAGRANAVGQSLGRYLAIVHNASADAKDVKMLFHGNKTGKYLSSTLWFGGLPAAAAKFGHEDEYLREAARVGEQEVNEADEVFTLGDYWTGNVLIDKTDPDQFQLYVVDLELSKTGTAAFDVGQMAAEMYCLQVFRDENASKSLLEGFLQSYKVTRDIEVEAAKVAIRIGAHLVVMMPKAWASEATPDRIKDVVAEGVELIRLGWTRDDAGLRRSIVSSLVAT